MLISSFVKHILLLFSTNLSESVCNWYFLLDNVINFITTFSDGTCINFTQWTIEFSEIIGIFDIKLPPGARAQFLRYNCESKR